MNIVIELTKEDIKRLSSEKKINLNTELIYKDNKIDDLDLFMKIVKKDKKIR